MAAYDDMMRRFGTELRKARERAGYKSAEAFAKVMGIEAPTYRTYERGAAEPGLESLIRICAALRIKVEDLFPGGWFPKSPPSDERRA